MGVIGFDLLQTPFDLQWGQDKDNDGIPDQYERDSVYYVNNLPQSKWDVDNDGTPDWRDASENPQLGMTAYKRFTIMSDPYHDNERYLALAGYNYNSGQYVPYDTIIPEPDDQRFLMASGPFELAPDSTVRIVLGVMVTNWDQQHHSIPDTEIVLLDHKMQSYYNLNWRLSIHETSLKKSEVNAISIRPNPVKNQVMVNYSLKNPCYVSLSFYNHLGQLVRRIFEGIKIPGEYSLPINTDGMPSGTYFIVLKTENEAVTRHLTVIK